MPMKCYLHVRFDRSARHIIRRMMPAKGFHRTLACFLIVSHVVLCQKPSAIETVSDTEQLSRMKVSFREWLSTSEKRDLMVEFDPSPQALDLANPRFSWIVPLEGRGRRQTAYQIQVASRADLLSSARPDLWDSKLVSSSDSNNVNYAGRPLESDHEYFWHVRVSDEAGMLHPYSRTAKFRTALLKASDWKAKWIGRGQPDEVVADVNKFLIQKVAPEVQRVESH